MTTQVAFTRVAQFSALLPLIVGVMRYRYANALSKAAIWFIFIGIATDIATEITRVPGPNLYMSHIDTILGSVSLAFFFFYLYPENKTKIYLIAGVIIITLFEAYEIIDNFYGFNSLSRTISGLLITIASGIYWRCLLQQRKLLKTQRIVNIHQNPVYWYVIGIMLLFTANLTFSAYARYLSEHYPEGFGTIYFVFRSLLILSRVIFAIGFYKIAKTIPLYGRS